MEPDCVPWCFEGKLAIRHIGGRSCFVARLTNFVAVMLIGD